MPYCTVAEVQSEFKGFVATTTSTPTLAAITQWLDEESNYIDGKIGLRYVVPVVSATYPKAFSLLRRIAIFRMAERIKSVQEVKSAVTQYSSEEKFSNNFIRTPNYDLDQIAKGLLLLEDVPLKSSSGGVTSTCGVLCDTDTCHQFEVGKDQW